MMVEMESLEELPEVEAAVEKVLSELMLTTQLVELVELEQQIQLQVHLLIMLVVAEVVMKHQVQLKELEELAEEELEFVLEQLTMVLLI
jgi:hypothetical protein